MISSRICRIRAFAAEGFEWVSTTRTWSRLTMTAALQFSMAVGLAIAPIDAGCDLLEIEQLGRARRPPTAPCPSSATARTSRSQGRGRSQPPRARRPSIVPAPGDG